MRLTFRILSALLRYPDAALADAAPALVKALRNDGLLGEAQVAALQPLIDALASDDLLDLQERYVGLFDRGRALSLHLFEHVHGESRDRGQAMVDLRQRYEAQGLEIAVNELPDYLPLFLEYLSVLPLQQALDELAQPGLIIAALAERLAERDSVYAAPMAILRDLTAIDANMAAEAASSIAPPDDPDDLEALDKAWEEEQVRFDAPVPPGRDAACPKVATMVARMNDPEPARRPING